MLEASKARWRRIMFNPLWREISTDPLWSKHWRSVHILFVYLILLLAGTFVMAFHSGELWLLSVLAIAIVASFFGAKFLARRYHNILNFLAENRSLDMQQILPSPPDGLLRTHVTFTLIVFSTMLVVFFYGTSVSITKAKQRALIEYQMGHR